MSLGLQAKFFPKGTNIRLLGSWRHPCPERRGVETPPLSGEEWPSRISLLKRGGEQDVEVGAGPPLESSL